MKRTPLIEFGAPVVLESPLGRQPVLASSTSGWLSMRPPSEEALRDYYSNVYGKDNEAYYSLDAGYAPGLVGFHLQRISDLIAGKGLNGCLRVHELGCSFGGIVSGLRAAGHEATGSDLNASAIAAGREKKGNAWIRCSSHVEALNRFNHEIDLIYASHTLEHDPNLLATLEAARGALTDRGLLLGAVPNAFYIRALLDGFVSHPWAAYPDHLEMLTPGGVLDLCELTGFVPIVVATENFEQNEWLGRHFGEATSPPVRKTWEAILATAGMGMELIFVLASENGAAACALAEEAERSRRRLLVMSEWEIQIRDLLAARSAS